MDRKTVRKPLFQVLLSAGNSEPFKVPGNVIEYQERKTRNDKEGYVAFS